MKYGRLKETPSVRTYTYEAVCGSCGAEMPEEYILPEERPITRAEIARVCVNLCKKIDVLLALLEDKK